MGNISIKGSKDGIKVYAGECDSMQFKAELIEKVERGRDFFAGGKLYIVDERGRISQECYREIEDYLRNKFNITVLKSSDSVDKANPKKDKVFSGITEGRTKFYKNTVRSGQRITYNGNVVVIGDVNSGAEIIANGNIIVLGVLRGVAHAGYNGNRRAVVAAYILQPSQLRIAELITRAPDEGVEKPITPEVAKIKDDKIIIEPYLPNKYL